jgi:hypothetical protein
MNRTPGLVSDMCLVSIAWICRETLKFPIEPWSDEHTCYFVLLGWYNTSLLGSKRICKDHHVVRMKLFVIYAQCLTSIGRTIF